MSRNDRKGNPVPDPREALKAAVPLQAMLGYLNFSEGRPDPRFQKNLSDACAVLSARPVFPVREGRPVPSPGVAGQRGGGEGARPELWRLLHDLLAQELTALHQGQGSAFRDVEQARAVLRLTLLELLPAYRKHHADLLFQQSEADLFQPFFLTRAFEAVLTQRGPWNEDDRVLRGALRQLNDYVGHRPIAVLESRPRGEPYDHERFRPIPLFIQGAGGAFGRYQALIDNALAILKTTDPGILQDAYFDPDLLDELAVDMRGYDFGHPADKRPNYIFGEWDPHHIDNQGRYRRFIVRQVVLEGLLRRVEEQGAGAGGQRSESEVPAPDLLWEAAAVLAGTILMAAGVSGTGPQTHDSSTTLSTLVPRIAAYRETFYQNLLQNRAGSHGERLREEAATTRQPFGGARQFLNQYLARHRAWQLQQRHLALLFAEIGYPEASRRQAGTIPVVSVRLLTEMHIRLTTGRLHVERGEVDEAARLLPEIEDLLHRGIACGAVIDPWNILGFQGQYPRFTALEDSVRDHRIDELVEVVDQILSLYAQVLSEGAAAGKMAANEQVTRNMRRLADWWDRFATVEVSDVPHVHGGEATASAAHVSGALARWHERGEASADLAFWREHLDNFNSPKAFALVIDALLHKEDYRAALALLMTWVGQVEQVPLEEGEHSFHALALRWMLGVCGPVAAGSSKKEPVNGPTPAARLELAVKFFDYLEANAEDYWNVPRLDVLGTGGARPGPAEKEEENLYEAAYEDVTYKDSAQDDVDSEVLDIMPEKDFSLSAEAERLEKHLKFLATTARLWNIAARTVRLVDGTAAARLGDWWQRARQNHQELLVLLDAIHEHEVPRPSGAYDSLVEYDRRRTLKENLLGAIIATCLDTTLAEGALRGSAKAGAPQAGAPQAGAPQAGPAWEPDLLGLEEALWQGDAQRTRLLLPAFLARFQEEPLLFRPLSQGGNPRHVLRASFAQIVLHGLAYNLPRLGLIRDTFVLVKTAYAMEQAQKLDGPRMTGFDRLFHVACTAAVEAVLDGAEAEAAPADEGQGERLAALLERIVEPFLALWIRHSKTVRVSAIEAVVDDKGWDGLRTFVERYGKDLFTQRFLTPPNLRGILNREGGVGAYLDYLQNHPDPLHPIRLIEELDQKIPRLHAENVLEVILRVIVDNYEEYRDYNATTTQSDFGENLHQLFDFLRLKASYERNAWQLRPLQEVHEVMVRRHSAAAAFWRTQVQELTQELADEHLEELAHLEEEHGMRLRTIADRLRERFVKPLEIDRLCAMIEPAMEAARNFVAATPLEGELASFSAQPSGAGLDVPLWLRRLEGAVQQVHNARTDLARLAESMYPIPKRLITFADLLRQMEDWEKLAEE
jgi:hypothetical protein